VPTPSEPIADPDPEPTVDFSVSAEQNYKKATDALAAKKPNDARQYFQFIVSRFPYSRFAHESELGLADITADQQGPIDDLCLFIEHHPFHPRVANGEVACLTHTYRKQPCVKNEVYPPACGKPAYCKAAKADIAKRPECKLPDRT
jgi:hypothetical protein